MTKHLVKPIAECETREAKDRVEAALAYFRSCVMASLAELRGALQKDMWEIELKRVQVMLLPEGRTSDIGPPAGCKHNFAEVVNQVANMRRLADTLSWASAHSVLRSYRVRSCHPTTSGNAKDTEDNDLILFNPSNGHTAHFEVSDVAGVGDGNDKLRGDLRRLRAIHRHSTAAGEWLRCPARLLFLAVSPEFAHHALDTGLAVKKTVNLRVAHESDSENGTVVLAVLPNDPHRADL